MLTAYDAPSARWGDAAGVDILLVGDSLAMVVLGYDDTLAVTLDEMIHHAAAVTRSSSRCLVVGDLPFGSFQCSAEECLRAGLRYVKEAAVDAVKLEGLWPDRVRGLVRAGIPVMGHLGLTPQSVRSFGGYRVQGRSLEDAEGLLAAACELERAGCFSLVLEGIPAEVAKVITAEVGIPTIGIGAGVDCDGQVLVVHDLLGISPPPYPRFVTPYVQLGDLAVSEIQRWADDVREGRVPTPEQSYHQNAETAARWLEAHPES
jgi:3-methyl-2-oxobutanoate hydroxymethyltransferase